MFKKNLIYSLLTLLVIIIHQNSPGVFCCVVPLTKPDRPCEACEILLQTSEQITDEIDHHKNILINLLTKIENEEKNRQFQEQQRKDDEQQRQFKKKQLEIEIQEAQNIKKQQQDEENQLLAVIHQWKYLEKESKDEDIKINLLHNKNCLCKCGKN